VSAAAVIDLGEKRLRRECWAKLQALEAQMLQSRFERDDALMQRTASVRLAEMEARYGALLNHLREPLLEMVELALIFGGDPDDYRGALGVVLFDLRHQRELPELLARRRATLPAEYARLQGAGLGKALELPREPEKS
jgi:hypothetical protein